MIATKQAVATTSGRMSASSLAARLVSRFIEESCSTFTCRIRIRAE
jgi:hypothetical protein